MFEYSTEYSYSITAHYTDYYLKCMCLTMLLFYSNSRFWIMEERMCTIPV